MGLLLELLGICIPAGAAIGVVVGLLSGENRPEGVITWAASCAGVTGALGGLVAFAIWIGTTLASVT